MHLSLNEFAHNSSIIKKLLICISTLVLSTPLFAADLSLSPSQGTYEEGRVVSVDVYITNNTDNINAVSGTLSFPTNLLSVRSISKDGSIIKLWSEEPSYSNANGTIKFEGVILNPGYSDTRGKVITVNFTAKAEGSAPLSFSLGDILANDGNATSVIRSKGTAALTIKKAEVVVPATTDSTTSRATSLAPVITSSTHPSENAWYSSRDVSFAWNVPSGVTAVRTLYNEKSDSTPSRLYEPAIKDRSFTVDGDGIMYMHVQFRDGNTWGAVAHRKFQIDSVPPTDLKASFVDGETTTSSTPTLSVAAKDSLSGLERVTVTVDGGEEVSFAIDPSGVYTMPLLTPGSHSIVVSVYDKALNVVRTTLTLNVKKLNVPVISHYTKRAQKGDEFTVRGSTYPNTVVELSFAEDTKPARVETITSDTNGFFMLTLTRDLDVGVYEMKARIVDTNGATSDWSGGAIVVIENFKLIRIGMFIMNWLSLVLIIILSSALVIATFWYSFLQFARFRSKIHRTLKEAEDALRTGVQGLRRDTEEFHTILVKAEKKRELTKEEQSILKKFKRRLDTMEKNIEKKLEQIG